MQKNFTPKKIPAFIQTLRLLFSIFCLAAGTANAQVYINGNLSTGTLASSGETAPAGTTWSEIQLGNTISGYLSGIAVSKAVADDFTVPPGATWNISSLTFYAYSTNYAGTTSPFDDLRVRIFDTDPSIGNPAPIFGDLTNNRLTSSSFTNMYRIFNATAVTTRMIWDLTASVSLSLPGGTYWIQWQTGTSLTANWSPPSTVVGTVTQPGNNALQQDLVANTWAPILDGPTVTDPQDMPFKIDYTCVGAAIITTQPVDVTACEGGTATFSCVATGSNLTYQWQVSTGGPFVNLLGATSATYTIDPVDINMNGNEYHVLVASPCGYIVSDVVNLIVVDAPVITVQPPSTTTVCSGGSATLAVTATGTNVQYQWEYGALSCAGPFANIPGATSSTLTTTAVTVTSFFRCKITNGCGTSFLYSDCATITVDATLDITTQPVSQSVCSGSDATFTVGTSSGSATYQWQVGSSGCGGSFSDIGGATSPSLTLTGVTTAQNNAAYRCILSSPCAASLISDCVVLTVNNFDINTQPVDQNVCEGITAVFNVATSASGVNYQWQVSEDNGVSFYDIIGATSSTLSIPNASILENGNLYRVLLTNSSCPDPLISDAALLTVGQLTYIGLQPQDVAICEGSSAFEFTVSAYQATYQWQVNIGTGWNDLPGETNDILYFTATTAMNGNQYRVLVTGTVCPTTVTSNGATLTVYPIPVVTLTSNPANPSLLPGQTATLTATAQPGTYSYTWQFDGADITGANSNTYVVDYDHAAGDYTATLTSQPGNCIGVSNTIHVTDAITGLRMQVYSNPNNGNFSIVYPNLPAGSSVEILDSHGQRAYLRTNLAANLPIHVDMHSATPGVYIIVVNNGAAERLATERTVIIH